MKPMANIAVLRTATEQLFGQIVVDLLEYSRGLRRQKALIPLEKSLEKAMAKAFKAQGKRFVTLFRRRFKDNWVVEALPDDLDPLFTQSELDTASLLEDPMNTNLKWALKAGTLHNIADLNVDMSFSVKNPRAVAYLEEHGAALVTKINKTTRKYIQGLVVRGADQGWSYNKMAQELVTRYNEFAIGKPQLHIDSRAHLIAVTEIGNAYEAGSFHVLEDLRSAGVETEKRWVTMGDTRVSDGCLENERAGWIVSTLEFPSGHMHPLRFPGCRCDFESRLAEEKVSVGDVPSTSVWNEKYEEWEYRTPKGYTEMDELTAEEKYQEWIDGMDDKTRKAFEEYTTWGSADTNYWLRDPEGFTSEDATPKEIAERAKLIRQALDQAPQLDPNVMLHRQIYHPYYSQAIKDGNVKVGDIFEDSGFMSSSIKDNFSDPNSDIFLGSEPDIYMRIKSSPDIKGGYIDAVNWDQGEAEFLMQAGTRLQIEAITQVSDFEVVLDMIVVP